MLWHLDLYEARQSPNKRWNFFMIVIIAIIIIITNIIIRNTIALTPSWVMHLRSVSFPHDHRHRHRQHSHLYHDYLNSIMSHASPQRLPHQHGKIVNINSTERHKACHVHPAIWILNNLLQYFKFALTYSYSRRLMLTSCQGSLEPCISWCQPLDFAGYLSLPSPKWKLNDRFFMIFTIQSMTTF